MILCGECKHWGRDNQGGREYRDCLRVTCDIQGKPDPDSDPRSMVSGYDGCEIGLITREDFGCVAGEPKSA